MSDKTKIYYNPQCSKCRLTKALLDEKGVDAEVIEYLSTPPSRSDLTEILSLLKLQPRDLMRTHETEYKDNNLDNDQLTYDQLVDAMVRHPRLIQRPIVIHNGKAAIGRPAEKILDIL